MSASLQQFIKIKTKKMPIPRKLSSESIRDNYSQNSQTAIFPQQTNVRMDGDGFDDQSLIELHKIYGNKWKKISSHYQTRSDSFIKNHFYSLLRRSLRKLNSYIKSKAKQIRGHKLMKLNFIFKLTNMAESERNGITNKNTYQKLLYDFLMLKDETVVRKNEVRQMEQEFLEVGGQYFIGCSDFLIERLINSLREIEIFFLEHNLNKKGKSKMKCPKKLELKREIIQRSLSLKESPHQIDEEILHSQSFNQLLNNWSLNQQWQEILSFEQSENQEMFGKILDESNSLDPTLFK